MKPTPMDEESIQGALRLAIEDAVDFLESEVSQDRIDAQRYFNGEVYLPTEEGRSKVVSTKVRDVIRMVKPVLMRTFLLDDKPVEFVPTGPEDIQAAEQATQYASWKFNNSNGYQILYSAFHDALLKKTGVVKTWWDEAEEQEVDDYSNLTREQVALITQQPDIEVLEEEQVPGPTDMLFNLKVARNITRGQIKIKPVPPEDFFVDSAATSIEDAVISGDRCEMRIGDLVEMGYDFDEVFEHAGERGTEGMSDEEDYYRRGYSRDWDTDGKNDPSMRRIMVTEAYMKMDIEGTGIPRFYQFICLGSHYHVLDYKLCDNNPYAVFEVDPEPHTFYGRSLADIVLHDQTAATSLLRALLDNVHLANNPRTVVNENIGNVEDAMNTEIGAIWRAKGNPRDAYHPFVTSSMVSEILPALDHYNEEIEGKTGVAKSSLGMDADALQSTTAAGVNAAVQAASAAVELMARNLAEGGMRQLFKLIMLLTRQHVPPGEMMRLNNQFVPVDPSSWNATMDLGVNVGLGNGKHDEKAQVLRELLQHQFMIYQAYGPTNGMVTLTGVRNTMADIAKLSGVMNADRYLTPMTPELEQQIVQRAQQMMQQQAQQGDPNQAYLQAEQMKAQARAQESQMKLQAQQQKDMATLQLKNWEARAKDDRERDKMEQEAILRAAELLGNYGIKVDDQRIRAIQSSQRQPNGTPQ